MRVAILDEDNVLIDAKSVSRPKKDDIDCGDLPADGTYRYNDGQFVKNGAYRRSKVDRDRALYLLIRAAVKGEPVPQECVKWCDWYSKHFGD